MRRFIPILAVIFIMAICLSVKCAEPPFKWGATPIALKEFLLEEPVKGLRKGEMIYNTNITSKWGVEKLFIFFTFINDRLAIATITGDGRTGWDKIIAELEHEFGRNIYSNSNSEFLFKSPFYRVTALYDRGMYIIVISSNVFNNVNNLGRLP